MTKPPTAELNPYAAPQTAGGYEVASAAGVGVWRDGNLLVMHREAPMPPICVHTGETAMRWRKYGLLWSYPIDWSTRRLNLAVPLCEREYRRYRMRQRLSLLLISASGAALLGICFQSLGPLVGPLSVAIGIGVITAGAIHSHYSIPLLFIRVRDPYLWIQGADPRFLAQLPEWTFG